MGDNPSKKQKMDDGGWTVHENPLASCLHLLVHKKKKVQVCVQASRWVKLYNWYKTKESVEKADACFVAAMGLDGFNKQAMSVAQKAKHLEETKVPFAKLSGPQLKAIARAEGHKKFPKDVEELRRFLETTPPQDPPMAAPVLAGDELQQALLATIPRDGTFKDFKAAAKVLKNNKQPLNDRELYFIIPPVIGGATDSVHNLVALPINLATGYNTSAAKAQAHSRLMAKLLGKGKYEIAVEASMPGYAGKPYDELAKEWGGFAAAAASAPWGRVAGAGAAGANGGWAGDANGNGAPPATPAGGIPPAVPRAPLGPQATN